MKCFCILVISVLCHKCRKPASLLLVGFNLGAFISPYSSIFMQNIALSDSLNSLFMVLSGGFICLAVIMLVLNNIFTNKEVNYVSMELADN